MSWLQRLSGQESNHLEGKRDAAQATEDRMSPGLNGSYDHELREKAGQHQPPIPPEYMGLEGEYDTNGLAKRTAAAFDADPSVKDLETLHITQDGSTIILEGSVPNQDVLAHLSDLACRVDGTKAINTDRVNVSTHQSPPH